MRINTASELVALVNKHKSKLKPSKHLMFTDCEGNKQRLFSAEVEGNGVRLIYGDDEIYNADNEGSTHEGNGPYATFLSASDIRRSRLTEKDISGLDEDEEPYRIQFKSFKYPKEEDWLRVSTLDEILSLYGESPLFYATEEHEEVRLSVIELMEEVKGKVFGLYEDVLLEFIEENYRMPYRALKGIPEPDRQLSPIKLNDKALKKGIKCFKRQLKKSGEKL